MISRAFGSLYSKTRNTAFASLSSTDVDYFKTILPSTSVLTEDLDVYNKDWIGTYSGSSALTLKPHNTGHVAEILKYCNNKKLAVVPQSGNTGLVGGSVPVHDEIILSMANMNSVLEFDSNSGIVRTEAGVILENLNNYANDRGYVVPLDLGAKGS